MKLINMICKIFGHKFNTTFVTEFTGRGERCTRCSYMTPEPVIEFNN